MGLNFSLMSQLVKCLDLGGGTNYLNELIFMWFAPNDRQEFSQGIFGTEQNMSPNRAVMHNNWATLLTSLFMLNSLF